MTHDTSPPKHANHASHAGYATASSACTTPSPLRRSSIGISPYLGIDGTPEMGRCEIDEIEDIGHELGKCSVGVKTMSGAGSCEDCRGRGHGEGGEQGCGIQYVLSSPRPVGSPLAIPRKLDPHLIVLTRSPNRPAGLHLRRTSSNFTPPIHSTHHTLTHTRSSSGSGGSNGGTAHIDTSTNTNVRHAHLDDDGPIDIPYPAEPHLSPEIASASTPLVFLSEGGYESTLVEMLDSQLPHGPHLLPSQRGSWGDYESCAMSDHRAGSEGELGSCKGGRLITFALAVRTASEHPYDAYLKQVVGKNANVEYRCFYLSIKDVERGGAEQDGHERQVELEGRMDLERIKDVVYLNDAQTQYL